MNVFTGPLRVTIEGEEFKETFIVDAIEIENYVQDIWSDGRITAPGYIGAMMMGKTIKMRIGKTP